MRPGLGLILCVFSLLAGCGGGDGGGSTPPPSSNVPPPPPPPPAPPPVIGASGGTVTEVTGASVIVPAGALSTDATIRIARDSTGAPAIPSDLTASGSMYVITPHGGDFANPVEVRIPAPAVTLQPNQEFKLAKAQPGGEWVVLADTELDSGLLTVDVDSFSFFMPVIVTYLLPIAQVVTFSIDTELNCMERQCDRSMGTVTASYTLTSNDGQLPDGCTSPSLGIFIGPNLNYLVGGASATLPTVGGTVTRVLQQGGGDNFRFGVGLRCGGTLIRYQSKEKSVNWLRKPAYPNIAIQSAPSALDVVEGTLANIEVVLSGGASQEGNDYFNVTINKRTIINWERSDDSGTSWRVVARSFETDANPQPISGGVIAWHYWSVRHGFIATTTDHGALIRAHACYTPPSGVAPPCVEGPATRLNVLQHSALPAIVDAPRSVLVRTGQTASLSTAVSGLPAPTLVWQTRAANGIGAWTDLTGISADTPNYTTPPLLLADNGAQYRVLATNALGSTASTAVTVSVSDLDVVPSITTQPANLSVASGSDAVFAIDAIGTEALSYQWRFNGAPLAGAHSPVLRLTGVSGANAGSYSVSVSNDAGEVDSDPAVLTVTAGTPAVVAPTIVTQPAAVTVNAGNTATLAVGVDGSGPLAFQWRRDGVNIAGATSAVLTFNSVALPNAGTYSVEVSNSAGTMVSNNTILDVAPASGAVAPTITSQPATLVVPPGGSGILAVGATGSGPLSYQWTFEGVAIGGATLPVLSLTNVINANVGSYAVEVSNSVSATSSQSVNLILLGAPIVTQQPVATTALEGDAATFSILASGSDLRYTWMVNGTPIAGAAAASYTTPMLVGANSGAIYSVIVYNGAGLVFSQGAVLTVQTIVAPTVLQHPANRTIEPGQSAPLCAAFGGTAPFSIVMQRWNGLDWMFVMDNIMFTVNTELCVATPALQAGDNGATFRLVASNAAGDITTDVATITVTAPGPVITATTLVSRSTSGATANNRSQSPSLSADGNLVAFISDGTNLVPGFTADGHGYVRNLLTGVTTVVNQTPAGTESSQRIQQLKLAAGGRYAVFTSLAGDLVAGDTNNSQDVFVRDLLIGTTERINVRPDGAQIEGAGNGVSDMQVDISADGRFVSFVYNQDLLGSDPAGATKLYLRDTQTDQTRLVASNPSYWIGYSALASGGDYLAYAFAISSPQPHTVMLHDVVANNSSTLFSLDTTNGLDYLSQGLSISGSGRFVAFSVRSEVLLGGSTVPQILAIDRNNPGAIVLASSGADGTGNGASSYPKVADDGQVLFATYAANLTGNLANSQSQALVVRDLQSSAINVASRTPAGAGTWVASGVYNSHALSGDGMTLALTASEFDMSGGPPDHQVYAAPRP